MRIILFNYLIYRKLCRLIHHQIKPLSFDIYVEITTFHVYFYAIELTVAKPEKESLIIATNKCIELYLELRENEQIERNIQAQEMCITYLKQETQG
ncbi:hypothetical protein [Aliivibrio sifiae]|uniref:hypothetical protein n=1 Tax=Aliivibrio sifiae TaxID=566293 RepID=UPI0021579DE6|nr:hypothetical protein [Aliivibrio sifiae]